MSVSGFGGFMENKLSSSSFNGWFYKNAKKTVLLKE